MDHKREARELDWVIRALNAHIRRTNPKHDRSGSDIHNAVAEIRIRRDALKRRA